MGLKTPRMTVFDSTTSARAYSYSLKPFVFYSELLREIIGLEDQRTLETLGEQVLGPTNLRSAERSMARADGIYEGGVAFERSSRASGIKGARCYSTAYSYQVAPNIASATVGSKRTRGDEENLALRTKINMVCSNLLPHCNLAQTWDRPSQLLRPSTVRRQHLRSSAMFFNDMATCSTLQASDKPSSISLQMFKSTYPRPLLLHMMVSASQPIPLSDVLTPTQLQPSTLPSGNLQNHTLTRMMPALRSQP